MTKHKWHKEIKAWADGAEIEEKLSEKHKYGQKWKLTDNPDWNDEDWEFRIKPQPKEPQYFYVYVKSNGEIIFAERQVDTVHKMVGKIKLEQDDD